MHPSALELGGKFFSTYCEERTEIIVVDIGSQNINGSLKDVCVSGARYIGVDFEAGKNVDIVLEDPYKLPFDDNSVDVIVCSSVFEHSQFFWLVYLEMLRTLKPDGLIYLNAPSNGYYHRYPVDCWRFYPDSGEALVEWGERNNYEPALLESFVADKKYSNIESDAWNDFVAIFVKDKKFRKKYPKRIIHTIENYFNSFCDDGKTDGRHSDLSPDFVQIVKYKAENKSLNAENKSLNAENKSLNAENKSLNAENKSLNEENRGLHYDIVKRDLEIDGLNNILSERALKIAELNHDLNLIEDRIKIVSNTAAELKLFQETVLNSTLWKVSTPLRMINPKYIHIIKVLLKASKLKAFAFVKLLITHSFLSDSVKNTIKNFLYHNFALFFHGTPSYEFWRYQQNVDHCVNPNICLVDESDSCIIQSMLPADFSSKMHRFLPNHNVDVIIPVYRGLEETKRCINSVLASFSVTNFRVIIINDASPDESIHEYLRQLPRIDNLIVLENKDNLGFTATVNRGISCSDINDVILLNSDTEVADWWIDRLKAQAWSDFRVGTVTPFSNNATICSYPTIEGLPCLPDGETVKTLDAAFAEVNRGKNIEIPTAVGFCMYIRRNCINEVGLFDVETFGKGYGEENDFCLRASSIGWKHILAADVFVFHEGEVSFQAQSNSRKDAAAEIIRLRYPHYESSVANHISENKALPLRIAATAARFKHCGKPVILHILHSYGGGTEKHVIDFCRTHQDKANHLIMTSSSELDGKNVVCVRSADPSYAVDLKISVENFDFLLSLYKSFGVSLIHIHHIIGYSMDIHEFVKKMDVPFYLTIHDYYLICPRIHLMQNGSVFCGEPDPVICNKCIPSDSPCEYPDIIWWREKNAWLFNDAATVICPSHDVVKRCLGYFPDAPCKVVAHEKESSLPHVYKNTFLGDEDPLRIVILGFLTKHKGLDLISQALLMAEKIKAPLQFKLIGLTIGSVPSVPGKIFSQTGFYNDDDLPKMIEEADPHLILFLSRCPETYSYTLSAAINSGRPVMAPALGAFPERLYSRPWTWLYDWNISPESLIDLLCTIRNDNFLNQTPPPCIGDGQPIDLSYEAGHYYEEEYFSSLKNVHTKPEPIDMRKPGKIAALVLLDDTGGHPSPCAYIRLILPLIRERGEELNIRWVDNGDVFNYRADVFICQRTAVKDINIVEEIVAHCINNNMKIVYDLDDYLLELPEEHPEFLIYKPLSDAVFRWLVIADSVWVSTEALGVQVKQINSNVHVIPNYIDEHIWPVSERHEGSRFPGEPLRILYMGTQTHLADFELVKNALKRLKHEFGNRIEIDIIGISADRLCEDWYKVLTPPVGLSHVYPAFATWINSLPSFDIGIAPLVDNRFNRCKSPIKFFDYSAMGLTTIASDLGVYSPIRNGENGFIVQNTEYSWYETLKKLIVNDELRNRVKNNAHKDVYEKYGYSSVKGLRTLLLDFDIRENE